MEEPGKKIKQTHEETFKFLKDIKHGQTQFESQEQLMKENL